MVQAGDKEHVGEGSVSERADASWSNQELSHYLVCVVEADASHLASPSQDPPASQAAQADVEIGVVAVEISTGDVLYGQFRYSNSHPDAVAATFSLALCQVHIAMLATPVLATLGNVQGFQLAMHH